VEVFLHTKNENPAQAASEGGPSGNVLSVLRGEHRPPPRKSGGLHRRASTGNRKNPRDRRTSKASLGTRRFGQCPNPRARKRPTALTQRQPLS